MAMTCWTKKAAVVGEPSIRGSCVAKDALGELYIEAKSLDLRHWELSAKLIYYREMAPGYFELVECYGLAFREETLKMRRGTHIEGECFVSPRPRPEAEAAISAAVDLWTSYSGLSKLAPDDQLDTILGVLKR